MRWRKRAASQDWWRVQALWTVGGERRSYRSVYCEGRDAADKEAAEMAATLSHYPTLEVLIAPATPEEAEADRLELDRIARRPPEPLHLMLGVGHGATACGAKGNSVTLDLWRLSNAPKCPTCDATAASGAS